MHNAVRVRLSCVPCDPRFPPHPQFPSPSLLPTTYTYAALLRAVDAGGMPGAAKSLFPDIHAATLAGELVRGVGQWGCKRGRAAVVRGGVERCG